MLGRRPILPSIQVSFENDQMLHGTTIGAADARAKFPRKCIDPIGCDQNYDKRSKEAEPDDQAESDRHQFKRNKKSAESLFDKEGMMRKKDASPGTDCNSRTSTLLESMSCI